MTKSRALGYGEARAVRCLQESKNAPEEIDPLYQSAQQTNTADVSPFLHFISCFESPYSRYVHTHETHIHVK